MSEALTLQSLPLFPLGTVLFPGGVLPLRIFEVRYLDMITRCHKAGAPFGVISLEQGQEVRRAGASLESFAAVGTLATIAELHTPQPGLLTLRAQGSQRFRVSTSQQLKHGLWVADVRRIDNDLEVPVPDDLRSAAQALDRLVQSLRAKASDALLPLNLPLQLDDCGWVANRWCELLPMPTQLKQRLLELDNPLVRLELINDILGRTGITA